MNLVVPKLNKPQFVHDGKRGGAPSHILFTTGEGKGREGKVRKGSDTLVHSGLGTPILIHDH
jgi:hypothetical protein